MANDAAGLSGGRPVAAAGADDVRLDSATRHADPGQ
jgi:hypothetical protein